MKARTFAVVLLVNCSLAFAHPAESRSRVLVRDERGCLLTSTQAVLLSRGRMAVPVSAYERLGLFVKREVKARRVAIGIPDSDSGVWLYAGSHRARDFLHEEPAPTRHDTPVAVLRGGRFYANASIMNRAFNDRFTTSWDGHTRTIILQRNMRFGQRPQKSNEGR